MLLLVGLVNSFRETPDFNCDLYKVIERTERIYSHNTISAAFIRDKNSLPLELLN